jgi:hypothetical protein
MTMLATLHLTLPNPAITASPTSILREQLLPPEEKKELIALGLHVKRL